MDLTQLTPSACGACGIPAGTHVQEWTGTGGWHTWKMPEQAVIKARMLRRREARAAARAARARTVFHARADWSATSADAVDGDMECGDCHTTDCPHFWRIQRRLERSLRTGTPVPPIPCPF